MIRKTNIALLPHACGKYNEIWAMNQNILDHRTEILGSDNTDLLRSMSSLTSVLGAQGKYAEAEKLNWQTLEAMMRAFGIEDLHKLTSTSNLALVL